MGGCFSVSLSCDQVVNQVSNSVCAKAAYIHDLQENLEGLRTTVQKLEAKRDDLLTKVIMEENRGLRRLAEVEGWLSRVEATAKQVGVLLNLRTDENQRLCLCGYASKNCISTYQYGKKVSKKRKDVESLELEFESFNVVAQEVPTPTVDVRPIQPTIGTESMLKKAWRCLMEDGVGILGLYGMGGVGKTTLLTQINNEFCKPGYNFDVVIWVVVSQELQVEKIQEEIGDKLKILDEGWQQKWQHKKASGIFKLLSKKKFVLLLDDIWAKVNLTEIGVPTPDYKNGCKVVFTTRCREVCGRMGVDAEMEVKCLAPDDAWDLFQKKVGENTLSCHPDIPQLAKIVAQKCRGLPLALNIIGETMASKRTIEEWCYSTDVLTSFAADFPGMEDEILPILKFSYDNLKGEKVKSCFLYCALFPEDYDIEKRRLLEYWVGEGIIDGNKERNRVQNEGYEIIGTLVRACLLEERNHEMYIKMHDVVREMALWVAPRYKKIKFVAQAGVSLCQMPKVDNWKGVNRMSLMENHIEYISGGPDCPNLLTLLLNCNQLVNISSEFFRSMPALVVLDLSRNDKLMELPEDISMLVSLQYLNLSCTAIRQLCLKGLRKLVYLNLEQTVALQSIEGISDLLNLQNLRLLESGNSVNLSLVEELGLLGHLDSLAISFKDGSVLERFLSIHKLVHSAQIVAFGPNMLEMKTLHGRKRYKNVSPSFNWKSLNDSWFQNLCLVKIEGSKSQRDLTWLLFAPHVEYVSLHALLGIKEIISKEKVISVASKDIIPFGRLEGIELIDLPELESIYWDPLPFPSLKHIKILACPKLRKLPLNSQSAARLDDVVAEVEWMEQVEWEDEDVMKQLLTYWLRL